MPVAKTSEVNWDAIKQEYVTGLLSINAIAKLHNRSKTATHNQARKHNWESDREQYRNTVAQESYVCIKDQAVKDAVSMYQKSRKAAELIIDAILRAGEDKDGFYKHVVQCETQEGSSKVKWVEDRVLTTLNAKNAADAAKAIKDLNVITRTLDDIVDAATKEKLMIEREKLELEKSKSGLGESDDNETGIALMPEVDESLLDDALPDTQQEGMNGQ